MVLTSYPQYILSLPQKNTHTKKALELISQGSDPIPHVRFIVSVHPTLLVSQHSNPPQNIHFIIIITPTQLLSQRSDPIPKTHFRAVVQQTRKETGQPRITSWCFGPHLPDRTLRYCPANSTGLACWASVCCWVATVGSPCCCRSWRWCPCPLRSRRRCRRHQTHWPWAWGSRSWTRTHSGGPAPLHTPCGTPGSPGPSRWASWNWRTEKRKTCWRRTVFKEHMNFLF